MFLIFSMQGDVVMSCGEKRKKMTNFSEEKTFETCPPGFGLVT